MPMVGSAKQQGSKVPEVTIVFWIIKIAATTLGETFGDTVTMTLNWGYLVGMAIFFSLLIARWFEKKLLRKKDYSIDNWGGGPLKTRLLTGILRLDFGISRILKKTGIRLPGLSCYCICQL